MLNSKRRRISLGYLLEDAAIKTVPQKNARTTSNSSFFLFFFFFKPLNLFLIANIKKSRVDFRLQAVPHSITGDRVEDELIGKVRELDCFDIMN
jgi:hypothetical protein